MFFWIDVERFYLPSSVIIYNQQPYVVEISDWWPVDNSETRSSKNFEKHMLFPQKITPLVRKRIR